MTYLNFLIIFLGGPLVGLVGLHGLNRLRQSGQEPSTWVRRTAWLAVAGHMLVALVYTTPWDNYLVASGVWTYDPALVLGVTFGWVPLEEYLFFLLQPLVAGAWLLWLAARFAAQLRPATDRAAVWRVAPTAVLGVMWIGAVGMLASRWAPGTYLALLLAWALPPIMLQLAVGGDVLWQHRRLVGLTLLSMTTYLSVADAIAIDSGTWTITPAFSLNVFLGPLPIEEVIFFLITNILIVFGITLVTASGMRERLDAVVRLVRRLGAKGTGSPARPSLARDEP